MKNSHGISVKLFAGFLVTPELRMHFNQSGAWKDARLLRSNNFSEVHHQGQDYFGVFIKKESPTLQDLKSCDTELRIALQKFCPDYDDDEINILIFPQTFVA